MLIGHILILDDINTFMFVPSYNFMYLKPARNALAPLLLWQSRVRNALPEWVFPDRCNMGIFKSRVNPFLLDKRGPHHSSPSGQMAVKRQAYLQIKKKPHICKFISKFPLPVTKICVMNMGFKTWKSLRSHHTPWLWSYHCHVVLHRTSSVRGIYEIE